MCTTLLSVSRTASSRRCRPHETPSPQRSGVNIDVLVAVPTLGKRFVVSLLAELTRQVREADGVAGALLALDNGMSPSGALQQLLENEGAEYLTVPKRGFATVRNAALRKAVELGASYLLFIEHDELPVPGWFVAHWLAAARTSRPVPSPAPERVGAELALVPSECHASLATRRGVGY